MIKILIRYIITANFFLFSYIIPKKKDLYIFGGMDGAVFSGNSKAMFLYYLNNDKTKEVYYMTRNKNLFGLNIPNLVNINSIRGFFLVLRSEFIFTDCDAYSVSPGLAYQIGKFSFINLRHGDPIKKIGVNHQKNFATCISKFIFDLYYKKNVVFTTTSSVFSKKNLDSAFIYDKSVVTGLPRNDLFFEHTDGSSKHLLGVQRSQNIILYAPTWRDDSTSINFTQKTLSKLDTLCRENNYIFLIKSHSYTDFSLKGEYTHIKDISSINIDVQELLPITNVLITDYSSIYIDFLLTDKPIIFYPYDIDNYLSNRNMYGDYKELTISSSTVYNEDQLYDIIETMTKKTTNQYKIEYQHVKNLFHKHQNGGYIQNVHEALLKHIS